MENPTKIFSIVLFILFSTVLNAQNSDKKLKKFVEKLNENIEIIHKNRVDLQENAEDDSDEYYYAQTHSFISPFWDYDFEVIQPFQVDKNGDLSMKIKYFPENDEPFIYSVKGNLQNLERAVIDIYFVLEFTEGSLETTYEYLNSEKVENYNDSLIHFGIDQSDLIRYAERAGIESEVY